MKRAILFVISLLLVCTVFRKLFFAEYVSLSTLLAYLETAPIIDVSTLKYFSVSTIQWPQWLNFIIPFISLIQPGINFLYFFIVTSYNFMQYVYYFFAFIFAI